jgi:tetratricopeptide (TPR) repeat protein
MKIRKEMIIGIFVIALIGTAVIVYTGHQRNKSRDVLASKITALNPRNGPPETIEGLRTAIRAYEAKIDQHVKDAAQTGIYWKILAYRLQDKGLHGEALDALERAIYYNPEDSALHYMVGVSAGIAAKSTLEFAGVRENSREKYFTLAEEGYLRALSLNERYVKPMYGLGVLYVFELGRPREAIPYLLKNLTISSDVDAMFVLARAYYMIESYREAVAVYEQIITLTKDADKRNEAQLNRQLVLDKIYG